jgi:hypothetical protein
LAVVEVGEDIDCFFVGCRQYAELVISFVHNETTIHLCSMYHILLFHQREAFTKSREKHQTVVADMAGKTAERSVCAPSQKGGPA